MVDQTTLPPSWNSFVGTGIQDGPVPPALFHNPKLFAVRGLHTHTHTHTRTNAHMHTRTHCTHAHTHKRTHAQTHATHATHARACTGHTVSLQRTSTLQCAHLKKVHNIRTDGQRCCNSFDGVYRPSRYRHWRPNSHHGSLHASSLAQDLRRPLRPPASPASLTRNKFPYNNKTATQNLRMLLLAQCAQAYKDPWFEPRWLNTPS